MPFLKYEVPYFLSMTYNASLSTTHFWFVNGCLWKIEAAVSSRSREMPLILSLLIRFCNICGICMIDNKSVRKKEDSLLIPGIMWCLKMKQTLQINISVTRLTCIMRKQTLRSLLLSYPNWGLAGWGPANPSLGMTSTTEYNQWQ